jgi:hypothetical protein
MQAGRISGRCTRAKKAQEERPETALTQEMAQAKDKDRGLVTEMRQGKAQGEGGGR